MVNDFKKRHSWVKLDKNTLVLHCVLMALESISQIVICTILMFTTDIDVENIVWHSVNCVVQIMICFICYKMSTRQKFAVIFAQRDGIFAIEIRTQAVIAENNNRKSNNDSLRRSDDIDSTDESTKSDMGPLLS